MALVGAAAFGLVTLGSSDEIATERAASRRSLDTARVVTHTPTRPRITGSEFPDGVLALTWDDGPDAHTVDLARYLHSAKVSGTFFVVGQWAPDVSDEPGVGTNVYATGYRHLPVLPELVALGHRLGRHTENHVVLSDASDATVVDQLERAEDAVDPWLTNELRMFRAPGGAWSDAAAKAISEPLLSNLVGPIHWDIDGKDWEGSLYCRSDFPRDCEPGPIPGRTRVRADVTARRYVTRAVSAGHGIVLMHDRVGHVGSRYALDVARRVVPELAARGFVFAAPVLAFGTVSERLATSMTSTDEARFGDVDGDGREDLCRLESSAIVCARATTLSAEPHGVPRTAFEPPRSVLAAPNAALAIDVADVDGDRRGDVCVLTSDGVDCALATAGFAFQAFHRWTSAFARGRSIEAASFRLADIDGDGRADACVRSSDGIECATSAHAHGFANATVWLREGELRASDRFELADVDGDGRADVCGKSGERIACAHSSGRTFGTPAGWSMPDDFAGEAVLGFADINRDGRADVCATGARGVTCALSDGRRFKHSSIWSDAHGSALQLADINGDGRADLCAVTHESVKCGLAP
jgi:peptidoglycan/xylan/chitin deacetylase (PgdA/CDA1 family)